MATRKTQPLELTWKLYTTVSGKGFSVEGGDQRRDSEEAETAWRANLEVCVLLHSERWLFLIYEYVPAG